MGFTTQCFIHKNTANIRNRLKELGYYCNPYLGWHNLFTCVFGINSVYSLDDYDTNGLKDYDDKIDDIAKDWQLPRYELVKKVLNELKKK